MVEVFTIIKIKMFCGIKLTMDLEPKDPNSVPSSAANQICDFA
jgi:hypothetical protein